MIIETILSTVDENNLPNFAPMGVRFSGDKVELRPFGSSQTYRNLAKTGKGLVNIVDDVLLMVETALYSTSPPYHRSDIGLPVLDDACVFYGFEVMECNDTVEPKRILGRVLEKGNAKPFKGFCRASFVVLEAAIMATRLHFIDKDLVLKQLDEGDALVRKTGGAQELKAFELLVDYVKTYRAV